MSRPRNLDVLQRNLQSVLRWSCIDVRDRPAALAIVARVLALDGRDLEPLRLVGLADPQADVMHNLRAAEARAFDPMTVKRHPATVPLSQHSRWAQYRRDLRRDLAAFLRDGVRNWETYLHAPPGDPGVIDHTTVAYAKSSAILQRRLLVSRSELLSFANNLDACNTKEARHEPQP